MICRRRVPARRGVANLRTLIGAIQVQLFAPARRNWTAVVSAYVILLSPLAAIPACESIGLDDLLNGNVNGIGNGNSNGGPLTQNSTGFFINNDLQSRLLIAGRAPGGDEFFAFGSRQPNGNPQTIDTLMVRQRNGQRSFIQFDQGWPEYAEGPNGSYCHVTYLERTQFSIIANVTLYDAQSRTEETIPVSFDGLRTAEQVAAAISRLTNVNVVVPQTPTVGTGKPDVRSASVFVSTALFVAFAVLTVNVVDFTTAILGQVLENVWSAVAQTAQGVLLTIFAPLLLIGRIVDGSLGRVEFTPLVNIVVQLPTEPRARA
jgi:hypothetical protein